MAGSPPRAVDLARLAANAARGRGGTDAVALDLSGRLPLTDAFVIVSGRSERNVLAIADAVDEALGAVGVPLVRREGKHLGRWELLDFGDLVVHVFVEEDRAYYALERLWRDCPIIELPELAGVADGTAERSA